MRLQEAVVLHDIAAHAMAWRETVSSPPVARFAIQVRRLSGALNGFDEDDLWRSFVRRCRRKLRELAATPLPPAHDAFGLADSVSYLSALVESARASYPAHLLGRGDLCITALRDLTTESSNPLGDVAAEIIATGDMGESGLAVQSPHLAQVAALFLRTIPDVRVITERELASLTGLTSLVVIGPAYWYPAHLLGAPRAELITFVSFDWLRDREPETRIFASSPTAPGATIRAEPRSPDGGADGGFDAETLAPTVDWDALAQASGMSRSGLRKDAETVDANLVLLAGGFSVYLEAVRGPTVEVVDMEVGSEPRLRSEQASAVGPGDYIVLRSVGGTGDYIPEIANTFLGPRAPRLRALQGEWKARLRERILELGFAQAERDLRQLGVTSPNLRYRLLKYSIRTRDPNDFRLLMEYVGLGARAGEIWTAMGDIFDAHVRAGQQVRRLLEEAVLATDTRLLLQQGRVDVRLREIDAGTLTVFRVEGRDSHAVPVDEDRLRVIRRVDDDLWQG